MATVTYMCVTLFSMFAGLHVFHWGSYIRMLGGSTFYLRLVLQIHQAQNYLCAHAVGGTLYLQATDHGYYYLPICHCHPGIQGVCIWPIDSPPPVQHSLFVPPLTPKEVVGL